MDREIKPYFRGQEPAKCGHFYPDVIRAEDRKENGRVFRVLDCVNCGRYETEIPEGDFRPDKMDEDRILRLRESQLTLLALIGEGKLPVAGASH